MNTRLMHRLAATLGSIGLCAAGVGAVRAQEDAKPIEVVPFDQMAVISSVEEVFGGEYDLGKGIAELVRKRLIELRAAAGGEGEPAGRVEGTVLFFGKEEGRGEAAGVSVGRLRVGLGRKREVALVTLEARLIDVASGQVVTMVTGQGNSDRGGWDVAARLRGGEQLANIDLSADEFKKSAIGEATHRAVDELAKAIAEATPQLGTIAPPAPAAEEPAAAPAMGVPRGAMMGAGGWVPYQFRGTEHFRYDVAASEGDERQTGFYQLDLSPAGEDRVRLAVSGRVGEDAYSSSVTTGVGPEGMQLGMGQMMSLGPIGLTLLNPAAWMMMAGRELRLGDGWSYSGGGESVSVKVERECRHGGQNGLLIVVRENDQVLQESCIAGDVALPLRVFFKDPDDESTLEMKLVEYRP